jgi:hypothetical protein
MSDKHRNPEQRTESATGHGESSEQTVSSGVSTRNRRGFLLGVGAATALVAGCVGGGDDDGGGGDGGDTNSGDGGEDNGDDSDGSDSTDNGDDGGDGDTGGENGSDDGSNGGNGSENGSDDGSNGDTGSENGGDGDTGSENGGDDGSNGGNGSENGGDDGGDGDTGSENGGDDGSDGDTGGENGGDDGSDGDTGGENGGDDGSNGGDGSGSASAEFFNTFQWNQDFRIVSTAEEVGGTAEFIFNDGDRYLSFEGPEGQSSELYFVGDAVYVVSQGECLTYESAPFDVPEEPVDIQQEGELQEQNPEVTEVGTDTIDGDAVTVYEVVGERTYTMYVLESGFPRRVETDGQSVDYYDWGDTDPIEPPDMDCSSPGGGGGGGGGGSYP